MKLSEIKDEKALEVLADILDPISTICADKAVSDAFKNDTKIGAIRILLKAHKTEVIEIMAALDGVSVEKYHCNLLTLPAKIIEILNDPEIVSLFSYAEQTVDSNTSGSASETIKGKNK